MDKPKLPTPLRWFDVRGRQAGTWAFMLNRLTALALASYLIVHLVVLHKLTQGPTAYNDFVTFAKLPLVKVGELLLVVAVLFHGLNGLRLIFLAFGLGVYKQKWFLASVVILTTLAALFFALHLFGS
jgi:succinate dehydrogenase / fumarate reductase, cytochrome b subunit